MRVTCQSISEFIENLAAEQAILQDRIRVSIFRRPMGASNVKFEVVIQASAIAVVDDMSNYLLEVGQDCGVDYDDASYSREGTQKAQMLESRIKEYAEGRGWSVLPGVIAV